MEQVRIRCRNNGISLDVDAGSTLSEVFSLLGLSMEFGPVSARVNNKVEGMHYRVYKPKDIEFLDMYDASAARAYTRTLFFVLNKAAHDLWPDCTVVIDIPVSNGYFVDIRRRTAPTSHTSRDGLIAVTPDDISELRGRMQQIIDADLPIHRHETTTEEAVRMFTESRSFSKVKLLEGVGSLYTTYYDIDGYADYYYGSLLTSTGKIYLFGLEPYYDGLLLRIPSRENPSRLGAFIRQDKMFDIFKEHHRWQGILGMRTIGDLNEAIRAGHTNQLIQLSEALQEKKIAMIADEIAARKGVRLVLIAGPSSSGKTTTCKRLSVQLAVNGLRPVGISLDDYFLDREQTPLDEKGDYDFEHLRALNIPLLNEQMNALFRGEEVELPRYDFKTGERVFEGRRLKIGAEDVIILEGNHALNPILTRQIPEEKKYRIYVSTLTTIQLDDHNHIPTADIRLLRRILRDYKHRGYSAVETIRRAPSVEAGEEKWIFPFQGLADATFNSALLYELGVIRDQVMPILEQVPERAVEYAEASRLRKFLAYFRSIPAGQVPPTSLLREFAGGSAFKY